MRSVLSALFLCIQLLSFCAIYIQFCTPASNCWKYNIWGYWKDISQRFRRYNYSLHYSVCHKLKLDQLYTFLQPGNGGAIFAYCISTITQPQLNWYGLGWVGLQSEKKQPTSAQHVGTPSRLLEKHSRWSWLRECQECAKLSRQNVATLRNLKYI